MHRPPLPLVLLLLCCRAQGGEIIGGTESKPHSRPYMAYLEIVTSQGKQVACGGFLIRRDFVLTAAHCAGRSVTVTLGAQNIQKKEDTWQRLEVIKQFPYPKYDPVGLLLKLKEKANLTLAVGTLPLPSPVTFIRPGRMCRVAGWGKTDVKEPASSTLQEVKLRLMEPRACSHFPAFDHNLQLCVGNPQSTKSAFKGDSGGPLLCAGVAQGIVSYGLSSAKPPAVFTRISPYRPWIDEVLKED
ncbi:mast cell protease 2-like [Budorcas taxicolor]|uniref:mast cell protease 2-like n=1 Tax=Budorcas taxicolor TaxID=37181 RepID=UPI002283F6BE|nr:mast cell protease 2-like [Budorcas taxicolor]